MSNNESTGNPRVIMLTDDVIKKYSENHVLTEYRDINLKVLTKLEPYPGGVYDQDIFGSMFSNRCNCGNVRTPGVRCPRCGSTILTETQAFMRFARIELPVLFSTKFKYEKLVKLLKSIFYIKTEFKNPDFVDRPWSDQKVMDICQWNYTKGEDGSHHLVLTDEITDFRKCSYEGLVSIFHEYLPDRLAEFRSYVNQYILVTPMILRPPVVKMKGNNRVLENDTISVIYQNILYCVFVYYKDTFPTMKTELGKAIFRGSLRKLISSSMHGLSNLFNSSKANLARSMQSNRLSNSGRCTVVPDPTLAGDEITIPRHLMYEVCRNEFIDYISQKRNIPKKEAEVIYKTQSDLDEVQKLFDEYIEGDGSKYSGKYVMINRAPSLYEFSTFVCKVKLTNDYTMKLPAVMCVPTGGDFDGDTYSFHAIPKHMNDMMVSILSARNRFTYKKNHKPLFTPDSEIMHGLSHATKIKVPDKLLVFDDIEAVKEHKKTDPNFKYQTLIRLDGKETTLARAILSELFDKDIDAYLEGTKSKYLNPKNITLLYEQLRDKPDRIDRIQKIQEFGFLITTISGQTAMSVEELYLDLDESYLKRIRAIEKDPTLSQRVKEIRVRDIHMEFQQEQLKKIPEGTAQMITDSARAKIQQFGDMVVQQFYISPNHDFHVAESTLAEGLNSEDYMWHSIENRSVQDIKQQGVPQSGYLTRQFIYLASEYKFAEGTDENNPGILLPRNKAVNRTAVTGEILGESSSEELVKVRSIVTSTLADFKITKDMLTSIYKFVPDSKIGMNLVTSFTEGVTQSSMSLKHGGNLFRLDKANRLYAPEDGKLIIEEPWIIFNGNSGKIYQWPLCTEFIQDLSDDGTYKKGDLLGVKYHPITQTAEQDGIIKLCKANPSPGKKRFMNNKKFVSECFALEGGIIHYKWDSKNKWMQVFVDGIEYTYNNDCLYYFPEGAEVKRHDRICTGTLDTVSMSYKVSSSVELYYLFRKQFLELLPIAEELIEFIFSLLVKQVSDDSVQMRTLTRNIYESDSFFKSLAFADHAKTFRKIDYEGMEFVADPITSVILSLVTQNEIE